MTCLHFTNKTVFKKTVLSIQVVSYMPLLPKQRCWRKCMRACFGFQSLDSSCFACCLQNCFRWRVSASFPSVLAGLPWTLQLCHSAVRCASGLPVCLPWAVFKSWFPPNHCASLPLQLYELHLLFLVDFTKAFLFVA